jgi:hypothetical protein
MRSKTKINFAIALLIVSVATGFALGCSRMDDYKKYLADGPIIYTGRVDSVKTYPGNNRIQLTMLLLSDPKITKVKVYWNNRNDSSVQNITRSSGVDTVKFMLTNMAEGSYNFEIYTYDNAGHSSVLVTANGQVYGQNYINSLFNRSIKSITYKNRDTTFVKWFGPSMQTLGQQINYTDSLGLFRNVYAPQQDTMTLLYRIKKNAFFNYRTLYKPDVNAIDTFYSQSQSVQVL